MRSATLPSSTCLRPVWPRVPMMMRSTPSSSARSTMADAAGTSLRWEVAVTPSAADLPDQGVELGRRGFPRLLDERRGDGDLVRGHQGDPHVEGVNEVELRVELLGELDGHVEHRIGVLREIDRDENLSMVFIAACSPLRLPSDGLATPRVHAVRGPSTVTLRDHPPPPTPPGRFSRRGGTASCDRSPGSWQPGPCCHR